MKTRLDGQHWFVLLDGKRHGPLTYADLTKAAREGIISAETNIWRSGWKNWHVAKSVKGLVLERPVNETPLAPDGTEWAEERPAEEVAFQYAPQHQRREARRSHQSQDTVALRWEHQPADRRTDHIFADEWRMLAEQPPQQRGKA